MSAERFNRTQPLGTFDTVTAVLKFKKQRYNNTAICMMINIHVSALTMVLVYEAFHLASSWTTGQSI